MQEVDILSGNPSLKAIVVEASRALAQLDATRLRELVLSCRAFTRSSQAEDPELRARLLCEIREAEGDMAVFGRVLEATRANLSVMKRLREIRQGNLEYTERQVRGVAVAEGGNGNR